MRRALYICAWVVLRLYGDLRDFYRRLRERGKPGKVATIEEARKLLMQLNAVARRGTPGETTGEHPLRDQAPRNENWFWYTWLLLKVSHQAFSRRTDFRRAKNDLIFPSHY